MSRMPVLAALLPTLLLAAFLGSAPAHADEASEAEPVRPVGPATMLQPAETGRYEPPTDGLQGVTAERDWQERRQWRYGTDRLFPLTKGLSEAGVPPLARWPLYPFTIAFDAGNFVFSALGGLYGN